MTDRPSDRPNDQPTNQAPEQQTDRQGKLHFQLLVHISIIYVHIEYCRDLWCLANDNQRLRNFVCKPSLFRSELASSNTFFDTWIHICTYTYMWFWHFLLLNWLKIISPRQCHLPPALSSWYPTPSPSPWHPSPTTYPHVMSSMPILPYHLNSAPPPSHSTCDTS